MHPSKKTARVAGLLYLLVVLIGPFILIYVPRKLYVAGNAAATASSIELLSPRRIDVGSWITTPLLFGEVALMLWLLIFGARVAPATAPQSS